MRNIPLFTTDAGVASLTLEEIPYKKQAYIRLLDTDQPEKFLAECADFCRMAGAEEIYATGHGYLERFPLHTAIWKMTYAGIMQAPGNVSMVAVVEDTVEDWRNIYNQGMKFVPNAATMTAAAAQKMLQSADGYFVYHGELLIGIGKAKGNTVEAIVSLVPGCGKEIMLSLGSILSGDEIVVEVASENIPAVKLYRKMGFRLDSEISRWHCVSKDFRCQ